MRFAVECRGDGMHTEAMRTPACICSSVSPLAQDLFMAVDGHAAAMDRRGAKARWVKR